MLGILIGAAWLGVGFIGSGFSYAHYQRKYPSIADESRRNDTTFSLTMALFGPTNLWSLFVVGYCDCGWLMPGRKP